MPPRGGGGGAAGASSRGRGGKFKKFTRGGGKHFSRDLRPLDADGNEISMWSEDAQKRKKGEDDDDDSEEDSEEDSDEDSDDDSDAGPSQQQELTREERKAQKKAQKDAAIARRQKGQVQVGDLPSDSEEEDDDDMPANPNHSKAARQQTRAPAPDVEAATEGVKKMAVTPNMSRKEREAIEKQRAAEHYQKLRQEGKTDEAKADLARLKLIREKREADAARRQAEKEEQEEREKERREEREAKEAKKREAALGKPAKKGKK